MGATLSNTEALGGSAFVGGCHRMQLDCGRMQFSIIDWGYGGFIQVPYNSWQLAYDRGALLIDMGITRHTEIVQLLLTTICNKKCKLFGPVHDSIG